MRPSRFLIIDGDNHVSDHIGRTLSSVGYRFDSASTAAEAATLMSESDYSTVLVADRLRDADGLDCFSRLRRQCASITGMLMTETGDVSSVFAAVYYGIDHVLPKPVNVEDLLNVISKDSDTLRKHSESA